jgi:hypothetical protein
LRDVRIVLTPDAFINPNPPHACQFYWEVVIILMYATFKALNPVLGPDAVGADSPLVLMMPSGVKADGRAWVGMGVGGGVDDQGESNGSDQ